MAVHKKSLDGVGLVTIEQGSANALDLELLLDLRRVMQGWDQSSESAMILTGAGRMFSAGVDLHRLVEEGEGYCRKFSAELKACFETLLEFPIPVVAAINGHAIAGGCILAAGCDHRVLVHEKAKMGITELLVGLPFPLVAIEMMRQAVAPSTLQELVYTGRLLRPREALELGLVDQVTESVIPAAIKTARQLAAIPRETFALTKQQIRRPILQALEQSEEGFGPRVESIWESSAARDRVRSYMASVLGKKR
ncbi:MAG: enoyl-CoA hydratase/isomerase family protein [Planctomycetota bacterium]